MATANIAGYDAIMQYMGDFWPFREKCNAFLQYVSRGDRESSVAEAGGLTPLRNFQKLVTMKAGLRMFIRDKMRPSK
jgi:hypothetical protein